MTFNALWLIAIMACLPFMALELLRGVSHVPLQKLRTWSVLIGASLAGQYATYQYGEYPLGLFAAIDFIAAHFVSMRPASVAQKLIGCAFLVMILTHSIKYFMGMDDGQYFHIQTYLGFFQVIVLFLWSFGHGGIALCDRFWSGRFDYFINKIGRAG